MKKTDTLQRFIFDNAPIRGEYIHLRTSFQSIVDQHPYPGSIRKLLGEALCVAGLLSAIIKFDGRLTVQFRGNGKLKLLLAQCNNKFQMRGLAKWEDDITYSDLMESLNEGVLVIMLDSTNNKLPYQGIVAWRGNSLAESIEGYFKESEQLATKIWLQVDEKNAAGLLLQVIPATDIGLTSVEQEIINPHWHHAVSQTNRLQPDTLLEEDYESLIVKLYPQDDIRIFPPVDIAFHCTCSRQRGEDAISLLGKEEAEAELQNKQSIVVTCDFCNTQYLFDKDDVSKLFKDKDSPTSVH